MKLCGLYCLDSLNFKQLHNIYPAHVGTCVRNNHLFWGCPHAILILTLLPACYCTVTYMAVAVVKKFSLSLYVNCRLISMSAATWQKKVIIFCRLVDYLNMILNLVVWGLMLNQVFKQFIGRFSSGSRKDHYHLRYKHVS